MDRRRGRRFKGEETEGEGFNGRRVGERVEGQRFFSYPRARRGGRHTHTHTHTQKNEPGPPPSRLALRALEKRVSQPSHPSHPTGFSSTHPACPTANPNLRSELFPSSEKTILKGLIRFFRPDPLPQGVCCTLLQRIPQFLLLSRNSKELLFSLI